MISKTYMEKNLTITWFIQGVIFREAESIPCLPRISTRLQQKQTSRLTQVQEHAYESTDSQPASSISHIIFKSTPTILLAHQASNHLPPIRVKKATHLRRFILYRKPRPTSRNNQINELIPISPLRNASLYL